MTFKEFMAKAKRAPKKDMMMAGGCFAVCIGLVIYFITMLV